MPTCVLAGVLAAFLCGCEDDQVRTYFAPKELAREQLDSDGPSPRNTEPRIHWVVPDGWNRVPGEQPMRVATFDAGAGDRVLQIVVSTFPGDAGGLLANINRWRSQLDLDPLVEQDLEQHVESFSNDDVEGFTADITGPAPQGAEAPPPRMLGALIRVGDGLTWFVKATGPSPVVGEHRDAFMQFARSFRPGSPRDVPAPQDTAPRDSTADITWTTPDHWELEPEPPSFAIAALSIQKNGATAHITITPLAGHGGGALANINRWRAQVGLGPVPELAEQPVTAFEIEGWPGALLDLTGPPPPPPEAAPAPPEATPEATAARPRMLVAMLAKPNQTWFFKMTGPDGLLEEQKPVFEQFVKSVQFTSEDR